MIMYGE